MHEGFLGVSEDDRKALECLSISKGTRVLGNTKCHTTCNGGYQFRKCFVKGLERVRYEVVCLMLSCSSQIN